MGAAVESRSSLQSSTPFPSGSSTSKRIRSGCRRASRSLAPASVDAASTSYPAATKAFRLSSRTSFESSTKSRVDLRMGHFLRFPYRACLSPAAFPTFSIKNTLGKSK